jgi:hypothetical protein
MSYLLIYGSEDGTRIVQFERPDELKQVMMDHGIRTFRDALGNSDTNYWPEGQGLLIEGKVAVPKPKEVVQEWDL